MSTKETTQHAQEPVIKKYKPRKILNLVERVLAIKMYNELPVYQRVASAFQCSWGQIKSIISNREEILQYYASCQIIDETKDDAEVIQHKKINFLSNCMYEYIKRVHHYHLAHITDEVIREKALEFRDLIKIEDFFPNGSWINDFKSDFKINLENIDSIITIGTPRRSLNCKEIMDYCSKEVNSTLTLKSTNANGHENQHQKGDVTFTSHDNHKTAEQFIIANDSGLDGELYMDFEGDDDNVNEHNGGRTIDSSNSTEVLKVNDLETSLPNKTYKTDVPFAVCPKSTLRNISYIKDVSEKTFDNTSTQLKAANSTQSFISTSYTINSFKEALNLMGSLKDFALMQEDFRAIDLLNQLSQHYEKSIKQ